MESWKAIEGEPNHEVSNMGSVRMLLRKGRIMKTFLANGYLSLKISKRHYYVHRLVALAFIPNPDNLPQVNHLSGMKTLNTVENLEWCTPSQNQRHAYDTGLANADFRRVAVVRVSLDGKERVVFDSAKTAGNLMGFDPENITNIVDKKDRTAKGYRWERWQNDF
jgi:NUMOD4 motif